MYWMEDNGSTSSIELFREFDIICVPFSSEKRKKVLKDFSLSFHEDHGITNRTTVEPEKSLEHRYFFINSRDREPIAQNAAACTRAFYASSPLSRETSFPEFLPWKMGEARKAPKESRFG